MKKLFCCLCLSVFLFCVGSQTDASPLTGTSKEFKFSDCLMVSMTACVSPVVHQNFDVALHSKTLTFEPVGYWTAHRIKIDGGSKASYVYLMARKNAIAYGLRN